MKAKRKHPLVDMVKLNWMEARSRFPESKNFKGCVEYQHTGFYSDDDFDMTLLDEESFSTNGTLCLLGPYPDGGHSLVEEGDLCNLYELVGDTDTSESTDLLPTVTGNEIGVILAALRHLEDAVVAGEDLTKLQDIVDIDYLQGFDINGLCESINTGERPNKLSVKALNDGENPDGIVLEAEELGDPGIYQEIGVSAFKGNECIAFAVFGLGPNNELRASLTADGNGYGDQALSIYPCRSLGQCIEVSD